jgi:hypothetical protein
MTHENRMRCLAVGATAIVVLSVLGCGAVRGRREAPPPSGFLGDYSQLREREGYEAQLVWVDENAPWSSYDSVHIAAVTLWLGEGAELADDDRQMITDLMYSALHEHLGAEFGLVDQPGPTVLQIRAAVTQVKGASVATRTISTLLPQALVLGTAVGLSADTARTVGTASLEVEAVDSITHRRLAAAVDSRAGTKRLLTTRTFSTWGDVEAACDFWAERIAQFLVERGVSRKAA